MKSKFLDMPEVLELITETGQTCRLSDGREVLITLHALERFMEHKKASRPRRSLLKLSAMVSSSCAIGRCRPTKAEYRYVGGLVFVVNKGRVVTCYPLKKAGHIVGVNRAHEAARARAFD